MSTGKLVVAITGASGAIYARRFVEAAAGHYQELFLMLSTQAKQVFHHELGLNATDWLSGLSQVKLLNEKDYFTPPASGSFRHDGMVIVPCSMGTAGRIANGISNDLVTRAADVCLKEGRKLILVPREMPWNLIMLRNLTQLAEAGATILPACPAWYSNPKSLEDVADTVVARILQNLGVEQTLMKEWMADE
ncbi:MAG: flavin prenyltransferase UbiX [Fimbriimonadaceae bacterium]